MSLFIAVDVDAAVAADPAAAARLCEVCPVDVFDLDADGTLRVVDANLDECVLCELCIQAAPGGVRVVKLYETE